MYVSHAVLLRGLCVRAACLPPPGVQLLQELLTLGQCLPFAALLTPDNVAAYVDVLSVVDSTMEAVRQQQQQQQQEPEAAARMAAADTGTAVTGGPGAAAMQ